MMSPLDRSCRIIILIDILTSNVILSLINFLARDIWKMLEIPLKTFYVLCFKRSHFRIALSWFCPDLMERLSTKAPTKLRILQSAFEPSLRTDTCSQYQCNVVRRPLFEAGFAGNSTSWKTLQGCLSRNLTSSRLIRRLPFHLFTAW